MNGNQAPDLGDVFKYKDRTYRVDGWLKPSPDRPFGRKAGPDDCPLEFCSRKDAVYVTGYAVCGVIAHVGDVEVVGRVAWPDDIFERMQEQAAAMIGRVVR